MQLDKMAEGRKKLLENLQTANSLSDLEKRRHKKVLHFLENCHKELNAAGLAEREEAFAHVKNRYDGLVEEIKQETGRVQGELKALFDFAEKAYAEGNELLILVTELTVNNESARFIASFGSPEYQKHSRELMLSERSMDIREQISQLGL